jgi:hypothetical protein
MGFFIFAHEFASILIVHERFGRQQMINERLSGFLQLRG